MEMEMEIGIGDGDELTLAPAWQINGFGGGPCVRTKVDAFREKLENFLCWQNTCVHLCLTSRVLFVERGNAY